MQNWCSSTLSLCSRAGGGGGSVSRGGARPGRGGPRGSGAWSGTGADGPVGVRTMGRGAAELRRAATQSEEQSASAEREESVRERGSSGSKRGGIGAAGGPCLSVRERGGGNGGARLSLSGPVWLARV
jgi:hypothetical protein